MNSNNSETRRRFLGSAATGVLSLVTPRVASGGRSSAKKPNLLFIVCDDLNDSVEGMGGHPQARTPNIDRLLERGTHFTNAHCNDPVCAPSRASFWSGLYPHTSGNYGFTHWRKNAVLKDTVTLMEHLRKSGYGVYGTGKLFHNGHEDKGIYNE